MAKRRKSGAKSTARPTKAQARADGQARDYGPPTKLTEEQKKRIEQLNKYLDYVQAQAALEQLAAYFSRAPLEDADSIQAGAQVDIERLEQRLSKINKILAISTQLGTCSPGGVCSTMTFSDCCGIRGCSPTWSPL
jgi:hypothetical protein